MKKLSIILSIVFCLFTAIAFSQTANRSDSAKLVLDFPVLDLPFLSRAAQTAANHRNDMPATCNCDRKLRDYATAYNNLSMRQIIAMSQNLHGAGYYVVNRQWDRWIKPTTLKRKIWNRVLANVTAVPIDYGLVMMPFGLTYVHEEFHRNVMSARGIGSFDEVWKFELGLGIAVTDVKDADLVYLKNNFPAEQTRLSSAGTEGNYTFVRNMQKLTFFNKTRFPNALSTILITNNSVRYVQYPTQWYFDRDTDTLYDYEFSESEKDFTGYDFSAWVYDLFRPDEPYEARGLSPNGLGLKRYIAARDLTAEEFSYIKKMGSRQYLNFFSPNMLGIQNIRLNNSLSINFAFRHILSSFGDDRSLDLFVNWKGHKVLITPHLYGNAKRNFPGLELSAYEKQFAIGKKMLQYNTTLMLWAQPKNQLVRESKGTPGALLFTQLMLPAGNWLPYVEFEAKTKGWVAGNPYIQDNFTTRVGVKRVIVK
jgi:hypothetical protein